MITASIDDGFGEVDTHQTPSIIEATDYHKKGAAAICSDVDSPAYKARHEVLRLLYKVLDNPDKYVDSCTADRILDARDDEGLVPLVLLHYRVRALANHPYSFLQQCLKYSDADHSYHSDFVLSSDLSAVGLQSDSRHFETDPYGYYKSTSSTPRADDVKPVVFRDGVFYVDNEYKQYDQGSASFYKQSDKLSNQQIYEFDRITNVAALGSDVGIIRTRAQRSRDGCFNCGSLDHKLGQCPKPRDRRAIAARRLEMEYDKVKRQMSYRLYEFIELQEKASTFKPGQLSNELRDALGIGDSSLEPPYYSNMRIHGFPPGYLKRVKVSEDGKPVEEDENENDKDDDMPDLNIFADAEDYLVEEQKEKEKEQESRPADDTPEPSETQQHYTYIQTVTYPGLYYEKPYVEGSSAYYNDLYRQQNYSQHDDYHHNHFEHYHNQFREPSFQPENHYVLDEGPPGIENRESSSAALPYHKPEPVTAIDPQYVDPPHTMNNPIVLEDDDSEGMDMDISSDEE